MRNLLFVTLLIAVAGSVTAEQERPSAAASSCADEPKLALLDFWLGEWTVTSDGQRVGTNRIARELDGCAVVERWQSALGGRGLSLFYVGPAGDDLKQVWVSSAALGPGGTKEKSLLTRAADGTLVFQGIWWTEEGREVLDRTRLSPLGDGRVRQVIEVSTDAGAHWTKTFDATYTPATNESSSQ
ncbi:MAG TPA: hypothetical protein VLT59_17810 [Steroidobacteraceae bacterium]|nr:hypothetical protein [Steroidobacteraceae bacterium]